MIPPLPEIRLRSILRWMKDSDPQAASLQPEALDQRAHEKDDQMMEVFWDQDDSLKNRLMKEKVWGTEAGLQQYNTERMAMWQEVCSDSLPTSSQVSED